MSFRRTRGAPAPGAGCRAIRLRIACVRAVSCCVVVKGGVSLQYGTVLSYRCCQVPGVWHLLPVLPQVPVDAVTFSGSGLPKFPQKDQKVICNGAGFNRKTNNEIMELCWEAWDAWDACALPLWWEWQILFRTTTHITMSICVDSSRQKRNGGGGGWRQRRRAGCLAPGLLQSCCFNFAGVLIQMRQKTICRLRPSNAT